jgi:hypothetical protein
VAPTEYAAPEHNRLQKLVGGRGFEPRRRSQSGRSRTLIRRTRTYQCCPRFLNLNDLSQIKARIISIIWVPAGIATSPRLADPIVETVVCMAVDPKRRLLALDDLVEIRRERSAQLVASITFGNGLPRRQMMCDDDALAAAIFRKLALNERALPRVEPPIAPA